MNTAAVSQRREGPGPRAHHVWPPPWARAGHRVGVEVGALATGEGPELRVQGPFGQRGETDEA
jgi:hypothetical protein